MAELRAPLPDHLAWLTEKVEALVRPGAFLVTTERHPKTHEPKEVAPRGGTFVGGLPDVPIDAPWANAVLVGGLWFNHSADAESFLAQINLEDIPCSIRAQYPDLPPVGLVWVTFDTSNSERGWRGDAYFDARPASSIRWAPRKGPWPLPCASRFVLAPTLTWATELTLPEIASDYKGLGADYDDWWQDHYAVGGPSDVQFGGWLHPIQGDCDHERKTLLAAFEDLHFGDGGAVYLHHSLERGFFVEVETH